MEIRGDPWTSVEIRGDPWRPVEIRGDLWRSGGHSDGSFCSVEQTCRSRWGRPRMAVDPCCSEQVLSAITNHISRMAITNHISSMTILLLATFRVVPIWCFCRVVSPCPFFQNDLFKRSPQVFQLMFLSCCFIFFVHCTKAL